MSNIFEDNSLNPFSDPEFRKEFLKDKGLLKNDKSDKGGSEDYEVIPPSDITIGKETGKVINPIDVINRSSKIPNSVGTIMHDLSGGKNMGALTKTKRAEEIRNSLDKIFTEYNEKYGLELKLDLTSTSNMLAELADPTTFRVYQLYLSEFMTRAKSLVYQKILTTILLLLDKIMEPNNLLGDELTLADQFTAVEKLINMLGVFTQFQDQIEIPGAGTELQKIANDTRMASDEGGDVRSKEEVKEFMQALLREKGIGGSK